MLWSLGITIAVWLLPLQLGASIYFAWRGRWKAIYTEVLKPTMRMISLWKTATTYIKAERSMIARSIAQRLALCVNQSGKVMLLKDD
jgi:hypothetical protein